MNRSERRAFSKMQRMFVTQLPETLMLIPADEMPSPDRPGALPLRVWRSRHFLVQEYAGDNPRIPGLIRLSINRTKRNSAGRWVDGITWDELQRIKAEIGYGDVQALEVYPPDRDVVNDANLRHLWVLPVALPILLT